MNAKYIASELVNKFYNLVSEGDKGGWMTFNDAKQCALIAVDELIIEQTMWQNGEVNPKLYWQEVKIEIEKL
jgi:hypothetical protein